MTKAVGTGLTAAAIALALLGCGSSKDEAASQPSSGGAEIVSASSLQATAAKAATPIYWAGAQPGTKLELSEPSADRTYVRYLTGGAKAGDKRADFLTVSTYVQPNAAASLRRQAKRSGGTIDRAPGKATLYYGRDNPSSVYLAYPGAAVEVEVFDPNFKRALALVEAGEIVAVD